MSNSLEIFTTIKQQKTFTKESLLTGYLERYKILFKSEEFNKLIDEHLEVIHKQKQISNLELGNGILNVLAVANEKAKITKAVLNSDFELPQSYKYPEQYANDVATHILACFNGIVFEKTIIISEHFTI